MRNLAAMATCIIRKVEIGNFFVSLGIFEIYFHRNVYCVVIYVSYNFIFSKSKLIFD